MQKPLTPKRLENIALYYLERFDASAYKLREVLKRRVNKQKLAGEPVDKDVFQWIEAVIQKCVALGYVDDKRYAENAVRRLTQAGKSLRFIRQKLMNEGIDVDLLETLLNPEDELERACTFVRKKRLGGDYEKDLAKLARAGFSYEIARQALTQGEEDDGTY